jgi:hypothetical protein
MNAKPISKTWLRQQENFIGASSDKTTPEYLAMVAEYEEAKAASDAYDAIRSGAKKLGWYPNDYPGKTKAGETVAPNQGFTANTKDGRKFMTIAGMAAWLDRRSNA